MKKHYPFLDVSDDFEKWLSMFFLNFLNFLFFKKKVETLRFSDPPYDNLSLRNDKKTLTESDCDEEGDIGHNAQGPAPSARAGQRESV